MLRIGLGVDCATTCGLSLVATENNRERLLAHWTVNLAAAERSTCDTVKGVLAEVQLHLARELVPVEKLVVAIELPYLGKNVHTAIVLARFCGRFEQEAERLTGTKAHVETASCWQASVLGRFGGCKREDKKKAAQLWARAMFGQKLTEDEADAAGLIVHVLRTTAYAENVAAAKARAG